MSKDEFLAELRAHIARHYRTQSAAAEAWGVSIAFANAVVNGKKKAPKWLLMELGYTCKRTVTEVYEVAA